MACHMEALSCEVLNHTEPREATAEIHQPVKYMYVKVWDRLLFDNGETRKHRQ